MDQYLECAMCGASRAFVISPTDPSTGYCFAEKREWVLNGGRKFPLKADPPRKLSDGACPEDAVLWAVLNGGNK